MKRTIILLACALGIFTANAQSVVESTKFTDNLVCRNQCWCDYTSHSQCFFQEYAPCFWSRVL